MLKLEDLTPNAAIRGVLPDGLVTAVNVQWFGSEALELTYKTSVGRLSSEILYRRDEDRPEVVEQGCLFLREPDFGVTSVSYDFAELLQRGNLR